MSNEFREYMFKFIWDGDSVYRWADDIYNNELRSIDPRVKEPHIYGFVDGKKYYCTLERYDGYKITQDILNCCIRLHTLVDKSKLYEQKFNECLALKTDIEKAYYLHSIIYTGGRTIYNAIRDKIRPPQDSVYFKNHYSDFFTQEHINFIKTEYEAFIKFQELKNKETDK